VRNTLRNGLQSPSPYQAARSGLITTTAIRLYRAGLA
jgi:hypothetical protein